MSIHTLTLETVSPIHIGAGGPELRREMDFAVIGGYIYMLNTPAVLNEILPADPLHDLYQTIFTTAKISDYLTLEMLEQKPELYLYRIKGDSRLQQLRPLIKTVYGRAYIPGSSLKGALRTAWLREQFATQHHEVNLNDLNDRREWAFQPEEARMLSPEAPRAAMRPNYDLFRAVQVTDSQPFDDDAIRLYNAVVFPAGPKGIPIDLEGIKPRVTTQVRLKLDDYILHDNAKKFGADKANFNADMLLQAWKHQGEERIRQELVFWTGRQGGEQVLAVYLAMQQAAAAAPANIFYIETGWGTGWNSKTMGYTIKRATLEQIMTRFQLSRSSNPNADNFPKTRRAAIDTTQLPRVPFGWLKVTLN